MAHSYNKPLEILLVSWFFLYTCSNANASEHQKFFPEKGSREVGGLMAQGDIKPSSARKTSCQLKCDVEYDTYKVKKCCKPNPQFQFGFKKQNYMFGKSVKSLCFEVLIQQPDQFGYIGEVSPSGIESVRQCTENYKPVWEQCRATC